MSEELDNNQDIKKKNSTKKSGLIEKYTYVPDENVELIMDRPSEPLINKVQNIKYEQKVIVKSNKELYESYIKELKYFSLSINNEVIYDSSIGKSNESSIKFENDYFILYGKKYSYNGLKIQKINIK